MKDVLLALGFLLVLIVGLPAFYFMVIVPFHFWVAKRMGWTYNPQTNRYNTDSNGRWIPPNERIKS